MEHSGFNILAHAKYATKIIKFIGKGALPKVLHGSFTDDRRAKHAIDTYLVSKSKKGASNAKTNSTTGSK